jgi:glycopeptide antibiotics resistance protein
MKSNKRRISLLGLSGLLAYLIFISWRLFFFAYSGNFRSEMSHITYNLIPLKTILSYIRNRGHISFAVWIYNLAGNIAAFAPLGFLLAASFKKAPPSFIHLTAFLLICCGEAGQLISRRGVFDVDDIILNTLGSFLGYLLYRILYKMVRREHFEGESI